MSNPVMRNHAFHFDRLHFVLQVISILISSQNYKKNILTAKDPILNVVEACRLAWQRCREEQDKVEPRYAELPNLILFQPQA